MLQPERDFMNEFYKGDDTAWGKIWKAYYANLLVFALRFVADPADREDIVTNAFTGLYNNRLHIEHQYNIIPYLTQSVYRGCLKHLENEEIKTRRLNELKDVINFQKATAKHQKLVNDIIEQIRPLIESLPDLEKKVLFLSFMEGLTNQEIAQQLDIAISTVYNNKSNALKKLKELVTSSDLRMDIKSTLIFILLFTDAFIPK